MSGESINDEVPQEVKAAMQALGGALAKMGEPARSAALSNYTTIREWIGATIATNIMLRQLMAGRKQ